MMQNHDMETNSNPKTSIGCKTISLIKTLSEIKEILISIHLLCLLLLIKNEFEDFKIPILLHTISHGSPLFEVNF